MEEERLPLELWRKIYNQREYKANKQLICDKLCAVLQLTNRFYDLESLEYVEENEYESHVYAKFTHGSGIVVTSMDNSWGCSDPKKLDFYYATEFKICCVFFMQQN